MSTASRRRAPSLLLGGAGFCVNISWQVVLPILSLYLAHVGFSLAGIGLVVGVFSLSMGVVELQASVIAAALGRRWSLLGGCVANALCLGAAALGHTRALVAVALAAVGAARGVLVPPLHATVVDSTTPEGRGRALGVFWLCTSLAAARQGVSVVVIGWIFAIQGGMYAIMQVPTGRLVTLDRGRWLTLAGIVGMAGTELAVPLLHAGPQLLAAGAVYGAALGLTPVTFAMLLTGRVAPDQYTAAMSVYNSAIDLGLFAGPLLGAAAARFSIAAPFLLALPLGLTAVAIGLRAPRQAAAVAPAPR